MSTSTRVPENEASTFLPASPIFCPSPNPVGVTVTSRAASSLGTFYLHDNLQFMPKRPPLTSTSTQEPCSQNVTTTILRPEEVVIMQGDSDGDSGRGGSLANSQVLRQAPPPRMLPGPDDSELKRQIGCVGPRPLF
ncbi:hypothetical protein Ciccas_002156 [Cichlidogyrus casuarinus]|uniref:Uncharacterized protein n=1 Tax=Cichlidogyrus casuarinus TaxID=1844966 RepID=A0ABD2QI09_9PLAT